jgi:hypothetical protein
MSEKKFTTIESMKYSFKIYILLMILMSCSRPEESTNKVFLDTSEVTSITINDLFDSIGVYPMYTNDSCLISDIRKAIYSNNEYYIFDENQKSILIFDNRGGFVRKIHSIGRGPGEYLNIEDFTVNPHNNNIELVDGHNLFVYGNDGRFIEKIGITGADFRSCNQFEIVNHDTILFMSVGSDYSFAFYSRKNGETSKVEGVFSSDVKEKMPFNTKNIFYRNGSIINYFEGFSNKVYTINDNGFSLKYEWDLGKYNFDIEAPGLSQLIKNSSLEDIINNADNFFSNYAIQFNHNIENSRYVLTDFFLKGDYVGLLYNKESGDYVLFNGGLANLIALSTIEFASENKLVVITDFSQLEKLPSEWFNKENQEIINRINISDNPVILVLDIKK